MSLPKNLLLAALPKEILATLEPHFTPFEMKLGVILAESGSTVRKVYFPTSGVISLVVDLSVGQMIETAMVGIDGVFNAAAALDGKLSLNKGIVQLAGSASAISVDKLVAIADNSKPLRSLLIRHEQVLFAQAQQAAACNASHPVEARMCKWLLRMHDLAPGTNDLTLTQEFLAQMLGVTRPSVSIVANTLQKAGLISYRRGHIRLLNIQGLTEGACECYEDVKSHYERMLAPV